MSWPIALFITAGMMISAYAGESVSAARIDQGLRGCSATTIAPPLDLAWRVKAGDGILGAAVIHKDRVYAASTDGKIHALALVDGRAVWGYDCGAPSEATPLILGDTLYCGANDGTFHAVNIGDGSQRWRFKTGAKITGSANWFARDGALFVVVGSHDTLLYCFAADSGRLAWTNASLSYINGTPAIAGQRAVYGGCDAFLRVVDLANGATLLATNTGAYIPGSPAIDGADALVATFAGLILALDISSGAERWRYQAPECQWFASPATDGKVVVIGGHDRAIHCLDRTTGKKCWKFTTGDQVDCSALIAGDKVAVASDDGLVYLLKLADGREIWRYDIGQPVKGSLAAAKGFMVLAASDGTVYAFKSR